MTFLEFCTARGLIIRALYPTGGKVRRCSTTCAPREKKGWYIWDGERGSCGIWHGLDNNAQLYKPDAEAKQLTPADFERIAAKLRAEALETQQRHQNAAKRAAQLLATAEPAHHAYLARKGFPDLFAPCSPDAQTLYVTMRKGAKLVNLQTIAEDGTKKFLFGGEVIGVTHKIGDAGTPIYCEGYATGLSVAAAIKASKTRAHCVVCFTAGNLVAVAKAGPRGIVIADNDSLKTGTGERVAIDTGLPYWMPETPGHDFNDYHRARGIFAAAMVIKKLMMK